MDLAKEKTDYINSILYWNNKFSSQDWERNKGKEQTLFFGHIAIDNMPDWLISYIRSNKLSICDFGCALGQITQLLALTFPNSFIVGQDISKIAIKKAKKLFPDINFTNKDLLQSSKEKYDIIFSSNTLELFYYPQDIIKNLAGKTNKLLIFLIPFYNDLKTEKHFYSFTYENIPRSIEDNFFLVFYKEIDTTRIPNTHWLGNQLLVVYAIDSFIDALEIQKLNLTLCKQSKKEYRLALIHSVLKNESERKVSDFLAYPIKQQLEQLLAQKQAEHQITKEQLEQALTQTQNEYQSYKLRHAEEFKQANLFREYVLSSISWKISAPLRGIYKFYISIQALQNNFYKKSIYLTYKIYKKIPCCYQKYIKKTIYQFRFSYIKSVYLDHKKRSSNPKENDPIALLLRSAQDTVKNKKLIICVQPTFLTTNGNLCLNGGAEKYITDLSALFAKKQYVFWIIQYSDKGCWLRSHNGILVIGLPAVTDEESFAQYVNIISRNASLVIASPFTVAGKIQSSYTIGISHGVFWDMPYYHNANFRMNLKNALDNIMQLVSVDTNTMNVIRTMTGDQQILNKLTYIPNYASLDLVDKIDHKRIPDFPKNKTVILFPRRLHEARGFYLLLDSLPRILKEINSIILIFVGYAEKRELDALHKIMSRHKDKIFHYTAKPNEMASFYEKSDIVLIPTQFSEGTSLSCLEAMLSKKAVIATCVGGLTDLIIHEYSGLLINPNAEALYNAIVRLIKDKPLRDYLANNAYEQAKIFNKERWLHSWSNIFQSIPGFWITEKEQNVKSVISIIHPATFLIFDRMKQRPQHLLKVLAQKGFSCFFLNGIHQKFPAVIAENFYLLDRDSQIDYSNYCIYTYYPYHLNLLKDNKPKLLIYDVLDSPDIHNSKEANGYHQGMLKLANIITTSSKILFNLYQKEYQDKTIRYIPNAADPDFFNIQNSAKIIPHDFPKNHKKTIGYYGSLADWFDFNLLGKIAAKFTDIQIVLIGPCRKNFPEETSLNNLLSENKNLFYLGEKKYEELPDYAKNFDVAIIPFVYNEITRHCSPVKLFEYMNIGVPIVTIDMPECRQYKSALIAKNDKEFIHLVGKALQMPQKDSYFKIMRQEANENTWEARAQILIEAINENLNY